MAEARGEDGTAFAGRLEALLGGTVRDLRRASGGTSRLFWTFDLERGGQRLPLVALQDAGRGPFFGTRFDLMREARTLAALHRAGVPVPAVHHCDAAESFTILDRLPGRAEFAFADDAERLSVIADFGRALARLHALDARTLDLPVAAPQSRTGATLADIADHEDAYLRLCVRHALVDEAFAWAKAHVPRDELAPAMVQGDAGPTNFMHAGGRLTGFIDWELAHAGDPHDDLAWVWFRVSMLGFDRDVADWFDAYREASGLVIDAAKLRYFIVLVTLRCTVANLVRQANEPGSSDERAARTRAMLEAALADARGEGPRRLPPLGLSEEEQAR
ncbi:tyrosine protein kinase:aminoglycoside phosphotransferase [Sphingobium jiangsuense]|uniref:Aminoglycoside phosphotransferase (APT) family kinase protein n=1 Tax=Sphingobium jiangsuense TaxID=870476 RepID=A0A7W6FQ77_9SPHN|nr:phosphotransferase family protein [Sphingobium jiangsuense]MBB3925754.1 aminoglycoside phosphotransferase (APT) family kinase protein [Sphingobium jiangsuense]GLT00022.1 tyrosine protein kinase:aminoglycoside phosphotransferase [Sphingobium jiangsuense]